ncbi:unnamed protein product [Arabidopsis lyrata]|nr:unnamed protein product [Arabidopsis lyrata]
MPKQNLHLNPSHISSHHHFRQPFTGAPSPIPPISPYSQIPTTLQPRHSRSMSQPSSFFSFDSLPPSNPPVSVSVEGKTGAGFSLSLPPSPFTMCHSSSSRNVEDGENR